MSEQEAWEAVWGKLPGIEWDQIPAELDRISAADPGSRLEWIDHPPAGRRGGRLVGRRKGR